MSDAVQKWLKSGEYLPAFMRDFHDQKDQFKTIHQVIAVEKHEYAREISWVAGQCYVIDIFLWYMAKHGYTLQKSRKRLPFADINATADAAKAVRDEHAAKVLGLLLRQPSDAPAPQPANPEGARGG